MSELQDFMARKISELDQRVSNHEQRLAAIERATTCGTGPNEPSVAMTCNGCGKPLLPENAWMTDGCPCNSAFGCNSPAQAEGGEALAAFKAAADIEAVTPIYNAPPASDAPPFHVGQVVECVSYSNDTIIEIDSLGWLKLEGLAFGWFGNTNGKRFRAIPPTAERGESEPTPGPCVVCGYEAWQKLVESGGYLCRVCDLAGRARDAEQMEREHRATIATLTRERDEARKESEGHKLSLDGYRKMAAVVQERWYQLNDIHRNSKSNEECAELVRKCVTEWNELPITEYSALAAKLVESASTLTTHREAAEAMEWLKDNPQTLECSYVGGASWRLACQGYWRPTPTAAILAARDAVSTGEKK